MLGFSRFWRQFLALLCACALAGLALARLTYVPAYTSETTFVVSNKAASGADESESLSLNDLSASSALANTFKYILLSDQALQSIIDTYGLDQSVVSLKNAISVTPVTNTNILEMKVVSGDPALSRDIALEIIAHYPDVLSKTLRYASLEVLNAPRLPERADGNPAYLLYPLLGALIAVAAAFLYLCLRQALVDTVKTVSDLKDRLGLRVLASIPKVRTPHTKAGGQKLLYLTDRSNGFAFAESYKALRTKVEMLAQKHDYKTFVVTSALEGEGKTTAAVNLAAALADNGKKVLLLDADLRNPSIRRYLAQRTGMPRFGLDKVLTGGAPYESAVLYSEKLNLWALPGTQPVSNSSELLSCARMRELVARLR